MHMPPKNISSLAMSRCHHVTDAADADDGEDCAEDVREAAIGCCCCASLSLSSFFFE